MIMMKLASLGKTATISQCWAGPIFAAFFTAMVIVLFLLTHSFKHVLPLFSFFPMAFYYGAAVQAKNEKQINDLQQRIEQLELQSAQPAA